MEKTRQQYIQDFFETAHKVFRDLKNEADFPFKKHELSSSQLRLLFLVGHRLDGSTVKEVADYLGVTSGAVTQLIDELVKKGFVDRSEDLIDRRVIRVKLSKKTRAI